jgi:hypothetical protein
MMRTSYDAVTRTPVAGISNHVYMFYRGPMHGIPFALKDIYCIAGIRTTSHSHARRLEHDSFRLSIRRR